ncbi:uncharacterized protein LOC126981210 isoform X1 [Eriocheir sinensis]|uniref:uncharacterized protein LOC126981210 isoform X1 n=1 Tax=Eriocheir sinensis TaxID=95602 RepID=UPI0021C75175|nr:uncharacterized protein LOC126981210 isoform X1 [Eriocheir sinensis]XP_050687975.1 uncharacterized protein LOC126981210 isoform X1 [Eriocheir sinensis]
MMEDANTECKKFCADWASFHKVTQVLVKAVRRIHHGVREEHTRLSEGDRPSRLRSTVLARHESAYKKVILGLQDYSANFLEMEEQYRELVKNRSKYCRIQFSRVVERHSQIEMQRDTILFSVEGMIKAQLRVAASDFTERSKKLLDAGIFDVIGAYNEALVKLKHIVPKKDPQQEEEEDEEDEEKEEREKMYRTVMPDTLVPPLSCLKQITASKVLQTVARERAPQVTQCIAETLLQEFRVPAENGTPLPWKPITFHSKPGVVTGDIFEDAIAKEEDENKINQQKLDLALRMEFGEDFPGTDYLPANDSGEAARPISGSTVDALIATNTELLNLLVDKFTKTTGVLVKGMVKQSKTGEKRLSKAARTRIETYYVERAWGEGSEFVEELMLWVPPSARPPPYPPPALLPPQTLFHILTTFQHFCNRALVPESCRASCEGLVDECRHLATSGILDWGSARGVGAYARASPPPHKLPDGNYSTVGGEGIGDVVQLLVWEVNEIERVEVEKEPKDWAVGDEVGLLLRLGGVVGSVLCWLQLRAQHLLHTWNTAPYYLLTQADLPRIIEELKLLRIQEREHLTKTDDMARLLYSMSRAKQVVMIEKLVDKVKTYEAQMVDAVSAVCRTVSLAQLQNSMPNPRIWRGIGRIPHEPHYYVYEYIAAVLEPVLDAVSKLGVVLQRRAGATILKVVCYAWLEHIKVQKIKFSLWGAQQLLKDFHALAEWLQKYPGLAPEARTQVLAVDVLRECEGVARLLMRQPPLVVGYTSQNQVAPMGPISAGRKHDKEVKLSQDNDDIPAEMYVPNQQLWLSLRARPASSVCVKMGSCCSWPY